MIDDLLERRNNSDNYGDKCIKNILRGYDERSDWQSIVAMSLELKSHIFDKSNYSFMVIYINICCLRFGICTKKSILFLDILLIF